MKLPQYSRFAQTSKVFKNIISSRNILNSKMSKNIKLNNGNEIPIVGLGTFQSPPGQVAQAVKDAIDAGYRHIDCAWFYANENEIGEAIDAKIAEGKIKREDLFVTSKLWNNFHAKDKVVPMIKESLNALKLSYLDLYLIHWPTSFKENLPKLPRPGPESYANIDLANTWKGMEQCVELGLAKNIGLSNFNSVQINHILKTCKIKPAVNQIEVHTNLTEKKLIQFCKDKNIVVTAYCPLGQPSSVGIKSGLPTPTIKDPKVIDIGKKYNKSSAQVILNYLLSLGITIIPKSVTKSRILENFDIFDFTLAPEDVAYLESLNKNQRIPALNDYDDHPQYPFHIEF